MSDIWFRTGEATVLAADGQFTDAMPEVLIGSVRGPAGHAFASMMGQAAGHGGDRKRLRRVAHARQSGSPALIRAGLSPAQYSTTPSRA